jgi:hypothetical protein
MAAPTSIAEAPKKPLPTESRPHRVEQTYSELVFGMPAPWRTSSVQRSDLEGSNGSRSVDFGQVKADQKARGRYLGGKIPFGFRRGDAGELVPHEAEQEAIREIVALRAQGRALRTIAARRGPKLPDQP